MRVLVPSPLHSYTRAPVVEGHGATLAALLADLDARHPGIRFRIIDEHDRIRPHIMFFVNAERVRDLNVALHPGDEVQITAALSGG